MKIKTKVKGFMSFNAVLLCLVAVMAGYSLLQIYGSQFSALSASRKALQAQQFAQSEADLLRNTSYDELDAAAHDRQSISGVNGWMSEVSIESETTINEVPQRLATVKVYRNGTVTAPDFSLKVPLSSAGGGGNSHKFKIINLGEINNNQRIVIDNPFPGRLISCLLEVQSRGKWGAINGCVYSGVHGQSSGASASQFDDDKIVIQTKLWYILSTPNYDCNPFPETPESSTKLNARIKVWTID